MHVLRLSGNLIAYMQDFIQKFWFGVLQFHELCCWQMYCMVFSELANMYICPLSLSFLPFSSGKGELEAGCFVGEASSAPNAPPCIFVPVQLTEFSPNRTIQIASL